MIEKDAARLYELADLIHAVARHLRPPSDLEPGLCTPVEIVVLRYVRQHPGTSARLAAEAAQLPSSNFSRIVRALVAKGLLRREADDQDARGVRLFPTDLAQANFKRMQEVWSKALSPAAGDPAKVDLVNAFLREIEAKLIASNSSKQPGADRSLPRRI